MKANNYHLIQEGKQKWNLRKENAKRATKTFEDKQEALNFAKNIANKNYSVLYFHEKDGRVSNKIDFRKI